MFDTLIHAAETIAAAGSELTHELVYAITITAICALLRARRSDVPKVLRLLISGFGIRNRADGGPRRRRRARMARSKGRA